MMHKKIEKGLIIKNYNFLQSNQEFIILFSKKRKMKTFNGNS